ncbi:Hypothetical Protein FCC1311_081712 [Hondaea fermentalgiana]|uniref:Uncharacterized protein n=1 Tax=Hondaea fermentalgiana TaxID=2315210 RepID=A0A2R5GM27_9STRA|nr:Hypothetical Protein FCC1311_081712 [Hondaea fermentalgiana]|eukprot:GBG31946.1 Hypothetical Protein FCC1311_081712 [Hondaea fermentalgiana]
MGFMALLTVGAAALNVVFAAVALGGVWIEFDNTGVEVSLVGDNAIEKDWLDAAMKSSAVALALAVLSSGLAFLACCCINKVYVLVTVLNCGVVGASMAAVGLVVVHVRDEEFLADYLGVKYGYGFAFQIITAAFAAWLICLALFTRASEDVDNGKRQGEPLNQQHNANTSEAPVSETDTMMSKA